MNRTFRVDDTRETRVGPSYAGGKIMKKSLTKGELEMLSKILQKKVAYVKNAATRGKSESRAVKAAEADVDRLCKLLGIDKEKIYD